MSRQFSLVDVFANGPLSGNPLAVVHGADGLGDAEMLRLTRWFNFSETAFLVTPTDPAADYCVRIFTPDRELPFAGHPTLGSAFAWSGAGGVPKVAGKLVQQCGVGLVDVRITGELLSFAAPSLLKTGALSIEEREEVLALLAINAADVVAMEWADNGPGWIAVQLKDAATVLACRPARSWLRRVEVGVVGAWPQGSELDFEVRTFFTDQTLTVREDPVTGSFNAAAAQWLVFRGVVSGRWVAAQGRAIGHDGRVHLEAADDVIWVGGECRCVVSGVLG